ncbi:MAG: ABC transporter substrate-binding protein [Alphaproteobacteria bacterium]|nr:ABC transporter substrate-binding protein [Alphaproteobacteria bacterium]
MRSLTFALAGFLFTALPAYAENTIRWSATGDAITLDPHAQNEGMTLATAQQIYEPLVNRDKTMALTPGLALSWGLSEDPTMWEFKLRQGVTFHGGQSFTADDVVFSFTRALKPTSDMKDIIGTVLDVIAVDDFTVRVVTDGPNPILPQQINDIFIMSRGWAEENAVTEPQDVAAGQETYAVRHTNGTGPFILELREPDVRTVLVKNETWWGLEEENPHNVDRIIFTPVSNAATRVAALLSGELDFVLDTPVQDLARVRRTPGLTVQSTAEVRAIFIGMDTGRAELRSSNAKGTNPFADIRVRHAINMAVDREAIVKRIMRGMAEPAGMLLSPGIGGYTSEIDALPTLDPEAARALLAEAGYADGFSVTLDCTNDRYMNDEAICQAVVGMLARIGITVRLDAKSKTLHFPKIQNNETDFYLLGWGSGTMDSHYHLDFLAMPDRVWNRTGLDDPDLFAMIDGIATETDFAKRDAMINDAWLRIKGAQVYVPLHHQGLAWAMKERLSLPIQPDNQPQFRLARVAE